MKTLQDYIDKLNSLNFKEMSNNDLLQTWDKTDDELEAVFTVADALRFMRENNISTKVFESGLGISIFRDNSTRTRFSFASACNLLGLEVQDLDEKKSQIRLRRSGDKYAPLRGVRAVNRRKRLSPNSYPRSHVGNSSSVSSCTSKSNPWSWNKCSF